MTNNNNIDFQELDQVTGGASSSSNWKKGTVKGVKNYLALRTAPTYDEHNETGVKFHNGDSIQVNTKKVNGSYIWARKKSGSLEGWVNKTKVSY